ncbi:flagellar export protein FliJ [Ornithinibacillus gellani]|uniref:flagellar export protein FliJ n=1 Tax=Ornithinibacillus gellani TaxID=2293253 RepID=UPI000F473C68|nr:flagellar export protein FliJ [Ornithinibacillus gellani]TQS75557.1 flagellar export protein FliJ [Ornithinibacillus gellani]
MTNTVALSKILHIREREKNEAQSAYSQAMQFFEDAATQLYRLLKQKEEAEESYEDSLQHTIQIDVMKEQAAYIEVLNRQMMELQKKVQLARSEMEARQATLTDAHVEVKKFEKIIEIREKEFAETVRRQETMAMDEVSIQQYVSQNNR